MGLLAFHIIIANNSHALTSRKKIPKKIFNNSLQISNNFLNNLVISL